MEPTQAQEQWQTDFNRLLEHALSSFYSAERAQDMRRTNKHAEYDSELSHKATVKADAHTDAKRHLTQWVQAHPYPATDQTAPTPAPAPTHADCLRVTRARAAITDEKQQYTNGWNDSMLAVEDVRSTSADPNLWANRMLIKHAQTQKQTQTDDPYARGAADAMTHFLNTGQADMDAPE